MRIVAATGNENKVLEFARILKPLGMEVISLSELGLELDVEENGETFADNARIKARAVWEQTGLPSLADDSGLCIDALGGEPGVHSARFYGHDTPYSTKMAAIVEKMERVPQLERTAQFVCAICCILDENSSIATQGVCAGYIGREPLGDGGFGYDPIFMVERKSFAQLMPWEKDRVSHRGKALRQLAQELEKYALHNRLD